MKTKKQNFENYTNLPNITLHHLIKKSFYLALPFEWLRSIERCELLESVLPLGVGEVLFRRVEHVGVGSG